MPRLLDAMSSKKSRPPGHVPRFQETGDKVTKLECIKYNGTIIASKISLAVEPQLEFERVYTCNDCGARISAYNNFTFM